MGDSTVYVLTLKEQTSKVIFRLVVPFANRLANLRLADWPADLQIGQIGQIGRFANWPDWQIGRLADWSEHVHVCNVRVWQVGKGWGGWGWGGGV